MRRTWWPLLLVAVGACGTDLGGEDVYDLEVLGNGFSADEGETLWLAVVRTDTGTIVATDSATIQGGSFSFYFSGLLDPGVQYELDYFADVNDDGTCEPPPTDRPWRRLVDPPTGDVSVELSYDTDYDVLACSAF